ncbi:putative GTP-binding protein EngB [bioreactor metagenome]|uniref:Putative GTP-binding protein EngB n=1 Tax=bioreactor metagenome TaxID=1076179 RepID=A0A645CEC9_9ZZZZ|nr:ribosome biogenesis GTP-binding protein YihA/YsxC [Oscillospiraceae bacterium]
MNKNNVSLTISAGFSEQLIRDGLYQIAFSGRSNVGKSSLINKLLNRKNFARVSGMPGKTITINYYNIDGKIYFVDLPGYGYAQRSNEEQLKWSNLVEAYFEENDKLKAVIQLIDIKVGATKDDINMFTWMNYHDIPYIVAATKSDKLTKAILKINLDELRNSDIIRPGTKVIPFSSLTGEGSGNVWSEILNNL